MEYLLLSSIVYTVVLTFTDFRNSVYSLFVYIYFIYGAIRLEILHC